jgi:ATP-binding cassette, subfamily B, bacterial
MSRLDRTMGLVFLDGFAAAPGLMWATLVLTIVNGLAQAIFPLGFKVFIDASVDRDVSGIVAGVVLSGVLIAVFWLAAMLDANIGFGLIDRMELFVSTRIAERVSAVASIEHFERPEYLQELDLLDQNRYLLRAAPRQTLTALSSLVRGVAMVVLLATVHPALGLLPVFGIAPAWAQSRSVKIRQQAEERIAEEKRLADELFTLTSTAGPAKELRVYGLTDELIRRHHELGVSVSDAISRAGIQGAIVAGVGWLVFVAGFVVGIALVIQRAVNGQATAGDVVLAVVLAQQARQLLALVANDVAIMLTTARTASRAMWLDDYVASVASPAVGLAPPRELRRGIDLQHVSFRYPGTEVDIIRDLDLRLPAGASVAIVGENGAGKTTLIKLLTGMYAPTTGSVSVDGTDLETIALDQWRDRITATFQDHVAFELLMAEAVGIGDLPRIDDRDAINAALDRASASDVVDALADGLDTQLGRSFPDGRELSGGQWQKLALGRGMMRDEPLLLILDEPTASLDAETEHALFERYLDAARRSRDTTGAITVIVSHRFSTVRAADLIVVLTDGSASEVGTHRELMAADGVYSELFRLQARAYA